MNKKLFFLLLVLAMVGAGFFTYYNPKSFSAHIFNKAYMAPSDDRINEKKLKEIYDVNLVLNKTTMGSVNTYLPNYTVMDLEAATYYYELFGLTGTLEETEDSFYCNGDRGTLTVYQYDNLIQFDANPDRKEAPSSSSQPISQLDAIEKAVKYVESNFLFLSYEESQVVFDGETFQVQFINRIGNIKSYAFNTTVTLDSYGNLLSISYFNLNYEKYNTCKMKSMEQAFLNLPIDLPSETKIDLKKCNLVYIYENSIIQPAYLFEGETSDGKYFQSFVKAAIYSY